VNNCQHQRLQASFPSKKTSLSREKPSQLKFTSDDMNKGYITVPEFLVSHAVEQNNVIAYSVFFLGGSFHSPILMPPNTTRLIIERIMKQSRNSVTTQANANLLGLCDHLTALLSSRAMQISRSKLIILKNLNVRCETSSQ
jgi:hypothetical protein